MLMQTPAYIVAWGDDLAGLAAYVYPSAVAARRAAEVAVAFADKSVYVIEREEDVTFSLRMMVDVFNGLTESGVQRFATRADGVKRLMKVLPVVARPGPQPEEKQVEEDNHEKPASERRGDYEALAAEVIADHHQASHGNSPAQDSAKEKHRRVRTNGEYTLRQQMDMYNELAEKAQSMGLSKFRRLGGPNGMSTFATRASGEVALAKIRAAIAEVEKQ